MNIYNFLEKFKENYSFLYDNDNRVAGYYEALGYGEKINMGPLYNAIECAHDTQQIESGEFYGYLYDLFGIYGVMAK